MDTFRIYEKVKRIFTRRREHKVVEADETALVGQKWVCLMGNVMVMISDGDGTSCILYDGKAGPETGRIVEEGRLKWIASHRRGSGEFALNHKGSVESEGGLPAE